MIRYLLSDESWSRLKEIMFHFKIYNKLNLRKVVEGILYRMRTGIPWRDLPAEFGCWNSVYQQFNRWSKKNKLTNIFKYIVDDPDLEWVLIDGTIVKVHQHTTSSSTKSSEAIGKSVSGHSTRIHLATLWDYILVNKVVERSLQCDVFLVILDKLCFYELTNYP